MDLEATTMVEEEEGSSNTGYRWLQQRCVYDRGKKRQRRAAVVWLALEYGQQVLERETTAGNLCSEGSLLVASKVDGSGRLIGPQQGWVLLNQLVTNKTL
ncbi:hypothetical protein BHE74_00053018 [Ensete ventricosum]|nr:hypothetical protein GW17_00045614 [Ensete ventricosum]RWW41498.1 hypothetical protein BHE74_00053018 [Ensete ventricosum]RZS15063.1 hypothetical protein BHM03_00046840 [Ensete ventricosum]